MYILHMMCIAFDMVDNSGMLDSLHGFICLQNLQIRRREEILSDNTHLR